jgi:hypothetical protein
MYQILCPHEHAPGEECPIPTMLSVSLCSCAGDLTLDIQPDAAMVKKDEQTDIIQFRVVDQHHTSMHAEVTLDRSQKNLRLAYHEADFVLKFAGGVAIGKLNSVTTVSCGDIFIDPSMVVDPSSKTTATAK